MWQKRYIVLLFLCVALSACGKAPQVVPPSQVDVEALWERYSLGQGETVQPFRTSFSLRFGSEGDTRRVTAILWGNSAQELRLDVNAGIGVTIAKILEDHETFLAYLPNDEVAFFHEGKQKPLFNLGIPIPLGLKHVTNILEGRYGDVFGTKRTDEIAGVSDSALPDDAIQFTLQDTPFAGYLVLNSQALPLRWQEADKNGWIVTLAYRDGAVIPYKLTITHTGTEKKAILLVKERSQNLMPFTETQMGLMLPERTLVRPLEEWQGS